MTQKKEENTIKCIKQIPYMQAKVIIFKIQKINYNWLF